MCRFSSCIRSAIMRCGIVFDDMHSTGIFSWDYLHELGRNREDYWRDYLGELAAQNLSRAPPAR